MRSELFDRRQLDWETSQWRKKERESRFSGTRAVV